MADESKIISDVSASVDKLTGSFTALSGVITGNLEQQKKLIQYIGELKKSLSGDEFKNFAKVQGELVKVQDALSKKQKEALDLTVREEKIKQQAIKTQEAAVRAANAEVIAKEKQRVATANAEKAELSLKTAKEKAVNASKAAKGAYERESTKLRELTVAAKNAAVSYGVNSKEARKLAAEQQKLDKKIKAVDASLGIHNRNVGNYKSAVGGIKNVLMSFGVAMGGAQIAMKAFNGVIENSQAAGDAWAIAIGGLKGAFEGLFQAIGTGENFAGIIQSMKDGAKAGREYAAAIDDLFEVEQGAALQTSKIETELAKAKIKRDIARAKYDREEALAQTDIITKLEEDKLAVVIDAGNRRLKAEREFFKGRTDLTQEDFESFLENYTKEEGLRKEAVKFTQAQEDAERELSIAKAWTNTQYSGMDAERFGVAKEKRVKDAAENLSLLKNTTDKEIQVYAALLEKWGGTTDEMITRYVGALTAMENAQRDSLNSQRRNEIARASEERLFDNENNRAKINAVKETAEKIKDIEERDETEVEIPAWILTEMNANAERSAKFKETLDEDTKALEDAQKERDEIVKSGMDELLKYEEKIEEAKKELLSESANAYFDTQSEKYEKDLEANSEYYDNLLSNELLDEEQRDLLEAQREAKENEIKRKERENQKKQFLFNQALKVADIVMSTGKAVMAIEEKWAAFPMISIPLIAKTKILGALQIGTVLAQSIPQLDKGTESTPEKYIAGEKRPEVRISKSGKVSIIEKPTLFTNDAGSKIIGGAETARMMDNINNYTAQNIVSEGRTSTNTDKIVAAMVGELIKEHKAGNEKIIKALASRKQAGTSEINRMRTQTLRAKLKN